MRFFKYLGIPLFSLFFTIVSTDGFSQTAGFSLPEFKSAIKARIAQTGKRDTIAVRVPNGESCVQASDARAMEIAALVKSMQWNGKFGLLGAKCGRTSGWNPLAIVPEATRKKYIGDTASGSMHTYTVVQIYDASGKVHYTIDADNYLGPIYISEHGSVDWNADHTQLIEDVPPIIRSVQVSNLPQALAGDTVAFNAVVDADQWVIRNLRYRWMLVNGTKVMGDGPSLSIRLDYPAQYNMKVIVYRNEGGREIVFAEAVGTMLVTKANPADTASGRRYTSRTVPGVPQTGRIPTSRGLGGLIPNLDPSNAVKGVLDVFKKAGDFFTR